jgi:DNA helicase-2/ATP-dependent DNA helicase PcrA
MQPDKIAPYQLRPSQAEILTYTQGRMGISAVPGSGKTWTLSLLAANLLSSRVLDQDQEILIVTLVNSAVDNFYQRVSGFVVRHGLIPNIGYRVRTLHGLANDIVRERPDLAGLEDNFQIIDDKEADDIRSDVAKSWLHNHATALDEYLSADLDGQKLDWVRRDQLPELVKNVALSFIRYAKDQQMTPERLQVRLESLPISLPLAIMGCEIFAGYQRALAYRGAVDFDDLIRLALLTLESDANLLERLHFRWPYILEDEAQDSSSLQERILRLLAGPQGNWVRVGDPNQAIYETFTTANPAFLRNFMQEPGVIQCSLPNSGRSTVSIINLANHLVAWTQAKHPIPEVRDALLAPPMIEPTGEDDPQPNPDDILSYIRLVRQQYTPLEEVRMVADSIERWLPDHLDKTVAVLTPRNQRAFDLVDELRNRSIPFMDDLLRSSSSTRSSAGSLAHLLRHFADPQSASKLAQAFRVWRRADRAVESLLPRLERISELIRKMNRVEEYVWPVLGRDWLDESGIYQSDEEAAQLLSEFRQVLQRWQGSIVLPIDQVILLLAQDIFTTPPELAVAYKLALLMRQTITNHPDWRLPQLANELVAIAKNERRFIGFTDTDTGFDPEKHRGVVIVSTLHKAKGLEWDRVYLMSVNNYDFPSGMPQDKYISEKWFIKKELNLEAETLAQLKSSLSRIENQDYCFGRATNQARMDYVRERLRLLYVGITRAKENLIITWNTGRLKDMQQQPAIPLIEMADFLENTRSSV